MDERDERKRTSGDASKHYCSRKSVAETYLLATRCPVYRRHDSRSGSHTELENLSGDAKGKGASSETARPKVPMRRGPFFTCWPLLPGGCERGGAGAWPTGTR